MTRTIVFDVNETLLDLRALDDHFVRLFGDAAVRTQWFGLVLRNALTLTVTGDYQDFVAVARASLQMVAEARDVSLSPDDLQAVATTMASLPPHQDVDRNLARLVDAGTTLAALTNSPQPTAVKQLTNAGVIDRFDEVLSVDAVERFKPAAAVYQSAAAHLRVPINDITMVAAHDWDIAGAMRSGARGAFVQRPGMVWNPLYPPPDISGLDLDEVVDQILAG
jgi:2-haloacid dehalogenase